MTAAIVYLFAIFISAVLLFGMVFFIIMFSDLECDFINPIDLCNRLNQFVLPEYLVHLLVVLVFLFSMEWISFAVNLPLALYHIYKFVNRKHSYDATEIFRTLSGHKKECFVKLGFYMLSFFYYLYRMVLGMLEWK